ncbi:unnamed protein product [Paramecium sonneborni]|uniref:Uncharacterized protein n=1 Tax=Paramecium sonneborni TaxID=65129 RepID=A0A8S1KFD8_9CILI|nr:unnamed protein product [Paramecium sonneborni]
MRRTTETRQISLFDSILSGQSQKEDEEKQMKYSVKNQNQQGVQNTKSLHNLNDIFYSNLIDYKDFKQSLRYNNKNLRKIALENIKNPHPKIIKNLVKFDLSGLVELKLVSIDIPDSKFELLQKKGGLSACFKKLSILTLNCQSMTSCSLEYLFQGDQIIKYLDLSHTKIDNQGIYYLSKIKWPLLETFVIQWCNKINNLDEMGLNAQNFPNLRILDSRFIQTNNEGYSKLINSQLSITLNNLRLYGTNVDLDNTKWKQSYLLNLFLEQIRGLNTQEFVIQNNPTCDRTTNDYKQMRIITKIYKEKEQLICINLSWKINPQIVQLQFIETVDSEDKKFINFGKLFDFLSKEWQLRKSLKKMIINFDRIQCDEPNLDILLKTIVDFKEIKQLQFIIQNQMILKPVSYYFLFNQISELQKLVKLQLDLQNDKLVINDILLNKIYRSFQQLTNLNILELNIRNNKIVNVLDIYTFNYQIITSIYNPYLNYITLLETNEDNLNYNYQDVVTLIYSNPVKFININNFQNLILQEDEQNSKEQYFGRITKEYQKQKRKLIWMQKIELQWKIQKGVDK